MSLRDRWLPAPSESIADVWAGCYEKTWNRARIFRNRLKKRIDEVWDDKDWLSNGLKCDPSFAFNPAAVRDRVKGQARDATNYRLSPYIKGIREILKNASDLDTKLSLLTVLQRDYDDTTWSWEKAKSNIVAMFNQYL